MLTVVRAQACTAGTATSGCAPCSLLSLCQLSIEHTGVQGATSYRLRSSESLIATLVPAWSPSSCHGTCATEYPLGVGVLMNNARFTVEAVAGGQVIVSSEPFRFTAS